MAYHRACLVLEKMLDHGPRTATFSQHWEHSGTPVTVLTSNLHLQTVSLKPNVETIPEASGRCSTEQGVPDPNIIISYQSETYNNLNLLFNYYTEALYVNNINI